MKTGLLHPRTMHQTLATQGAAPRKPVASAKKETAPNLSKLSLNDLFSESWQLGDKKRRYGLTDGNQARLNAVDNRLEQIAKQRGFQSANALYIQIRSRLDD